MTDRIQVGDLVYYINSWDEVKYYCVVHSTHCNEVWGTWRETPVEALAVTPYPNGFMPENEVFLVDGTSERKRRRLSKLKGIVKFLEEQEQSCA